MFFQKKGSGHFRQGVGADDAKIKRMEELPILVKKH